MDDQESIFPYRDLQHNLISSISRKNRRQEINREGNRMQSIYKFKENVMLYENRQIVPQDKRDRYPA